MKWSNVNLIFSREMRDQLRDRRTLFTVVIMPLILYPLMGMAMLQVSQFLREHPTDIWIVGAENLPSSPALIKNGKINPRWTNKKNQKLLNLVSTQEGDREFRSLIEKFKQSPDGHGSQLVDRLLAEQMTERKVDLAVIIPSPVHSPQSIDGTGNQNPATIYVFRNSARDKSEIAARRFEQILNRWQNSFVEDVLDNNNIPQSFVKGVKIASADVADANGKSAAMWSKVLPFIVMIWSLTGAFYPAIDLCAGEKERGTFETLLSSPAQRSEIAIGKLLTVMAFSMATSLLNLLSMAFTGMFVYAKMTAGLGVIPVGPPPVASLVWLVIALVPISALFSAIALAAAAFARSSKEGQYYLVPLMMISMPLMVIPMLPAAKLDIGTSLIPVSGLMLLLRSLIEGQYHEAIKYFGPVCAITLIGCWLSIRWVIHQFNSETVLFRASERFAVTAWLKQVLRQRNELPSVGNAMLCVVVILVLKFFVGFAAGVPDSFVSFSKITIISLIATVLAPSLLMAVILTTDYRKTLKLVPCSIPIACAAVVMAICFHPIILAFSGLVLEIYPPASDMVAFETLFAHILGDAPGIWAILLVMAVAPAIFEELAFRGFILSGLEKLQNKWQTIFIASLCFGLAHSVLQQSVVTAVLGMILGILAVQTRSILPCVLYHVTHNSLTTLLSMAKADDVLRSPLLSNMLHSPDGQLCEYNLFATIAMTVIACGLLGWILKYNPTPPNQQRPTPPGEIDPPDTAGALETPA